MTSVVTKDFISQKYIPAGGEIEVRPNIYFSHAQMFRKGVQAFMRTPKSGFINSQAIFRTEIWCETALSIITSFLIGGIEGVTIAPGLHD